MARTEDHGGADLIGQPLQCRSHRFRVSIVGKRDPAVNRRPADVHRSRRTNMLDDIMDRNLKRPVVCPIA
jgi:hypothetical protein